MRIEYYDADTHDLIRRDAYSQALVDALRERDEARAELAEIRRIVTETLPDLADQPDRETTVRRVAALATRYQYERDAAALLRKDVDRWEATSQAQAIEEHKLRAEVDRLCGELDYRNEAPDAAVLRAEGTTLAKMTRDAVGDEPDAHALAVYGYVSKVDQFLTRLRAAPPVYLTDIDKSVGAISGIVGVSNAAAVRECITKHTRPLDQTPPTVNLTDIEAASYDVCAANYPGGIDSDRAEEVLRKHTRAVSVESVAQALYESAAPRTVHDWPLASGVTKETYIVQARAALRAIGARLAEPAAQPAKPREGFVVDRDRFNGIANRAGLAVARAIDECIAEIERQRAEFERRGGR